MGKLKPVQSAQEFCDVLAKSQLLDDEQLETVRKLAEQTTDAKAVARTLIKRGVLTQWQAQQILGGWHYLHIGKYRLQDQIGKGELGRTFAAEHLQMGRRVAIKTLASRHTSNPELVKRFLADAREAAALDHRNILHVYDVDSEGDRYYVVTELAEGQDFQQLVDEHGPLTQQTVAEYVRQAAFGLAHAHERGMIHRDIKPTNLIVDRHGVVKIVDMGVGRLAESNESADSGDAAPETRAYLSPEQADGKATVDARADIYSLGQTAWFLITGNSPAKEQDRQSTELAPELAELFGKMTAESPDERPATILEAAESLESWLAENAFEEDPLDMESAASDDAGGPVISIPEASKPAETVSAFNWSPEPVGRAKSKTKSEPETKAEPVPAKQPAAATATKAAVKEKPLPKAKKVAKPSSASDSQPAIAIDVPSKVAVDEAPANPSGAFAVNTKKKSKAAVQPAASPAEAAPESDELVAPVKKPLPLGLIIGGAAVAGVLLLSGIGGAAFWLLTRGGGEQVASVETNEVATETTEPEVNPEEDWVDPEAAWDNSEPVATTSVNDAVTSIESPANEVNASTTSVESPNTEANTTVAADDAVPATETTEPPPSADPETTDVATTPPEKTDADATPAEPMPESPAPAKPPKTNPKPAQPPKNPKLDKPFQDMPAVVELPVIEEGAAPEPFVLGSIYSQASDICFMRLIGGEHAFKAPALFEIKNANGGTAERDWEVHLSGVGEGKPTIATLSLNEDKLTFQWTPDGAAEPTAAYLMNCVLHMDLNQHAQDVVLRKPLPVDPITFSLQKSPSPEKVNLETTPEDEYLKVEILKLDGPFPKYVADPNQPISATNGTQSLMFGEKPEDQILYAKIDTAKRGKAIEFKFGLFLRVPNSPRPIPFVAAQLPKMKQGVSLQLQQANFALNQVAQLEKEVKDPRRQSQLGIPAKKQLAEQTQQQMIQAEQQLAALEQIVQATGEGGQMQFRIFYDADGTQIDLARSDITADLPAGN